MGGKYDVSRALPLNRSGDVFFSEKIDVKITAMALSQFNDYPCLEAKNLHQLVSLALKGDDFTGVEVVGKFPTKDEAAEFGVKLGGVVWLPQYPVTWYQAYLNNFKNKNIN